MLRFKGDTMNNCAGTKVELGSLPGKLDFPGIAQCCGVIVGYYV